MKHIYITGASGVIGSELASFFDAESNCCTHAVSRRPCPTLAADHPYQKQVSTIFDAGWLDKNHRDASILHCAGLSSPRQKYQNFAVLLREHVLPHIEMVEAMLARGWRGRLVFFSSGGTVYGNALEIPIKETHPTSPISLYGLHKVCLEQAFTQLADERGFELVILRVSNPYGSMLSKPNQGVIPILINALLNDKPFQIIGDGSAERDYLAINDLCRAVDSVIKADIDAPSTTFNIGSGQRISLNHLIDTLEKLTGNTLDCTNIETKHDVQSNVLCCDKAQSELGWKPEISLEQGLKAFLERLKKSPGTE